MATQNPNPVLDRDYAKIADDGDWNLVSYASAEQALPTPAPGALFAEFRTVAAGGALPAASLKGHTLVAGQALSASLIGDGDLCGRIAAGSGDADSTLEVVVS